MKRLIDDHRHVDAPLEAFQFSQPASSDRSHHCDHSDHSDCSKRCLAEVTCDSSPCDLSLRAVIISRSQAARLVVGSAVILIILLSLAFQLGRISSLCQPPLIDNKHDNFSSGFKKLTRNRLIALTFSVISSRRRILVSDPVDSTSPETSSATPNSSQISALADGGSALLTDTSAENKSDESRETDESEFWNELAADTFDAETSILNTTGSKLVTKVTDGASEGSDDRGSGDNSESRGESDERYYTADGLERLKDPCGGIGGSSYNGRNSSHSGSNGSRSSSSGRCYNWRCHRRTKSGYCVKELLSLYDEAYRPLWPARVDLVVRSYVSDNFFLTAFLFASIEQMWPAGIGDVILVLDEADRHVEDIVPPWVKIYYEKNVLDLPGKILQQWSYLWADNYTTAPYIAIIDDDVIFNLKVTPGLLFNLTNGKPYVIGSKNTQSDNWKPSSYYFVGRYHANYMVQLPFVFPRSVLPEFRRRAAKRHKKDFNAAVKYFADHGPSFAKTQIAHTTLGNYMWFFANDSVHWVLEWTPVTPLPRVGVHIPYTMKFRNITGHSGPEHRLAKAYVDVVGFYAHEGMCHAFPEGKLRNCEDVAGPQDQIWRYAMDWDDWPMIRKHVQGAKVLYDWYQWELQCMYSQVVLARTHDWRTDEVENNRKMLVEDLRKKCIPSNQA